MAQWYPDSMAVGVAKKDPWRARRRPGPVTGRPLSPFEHVIVGDTKHRGELGCGDPSLGEVEVVHRSGVLSGHAVESAPRSVPRGARAGVAERAYSAASSRGQQRAPGRGTVRKRLRCETGLRAVSARPAVPTGTFQFCPLIHPLNRHYERLTLAGRANPPMPPEYARP
jgi:hypothetical protein